MESSTHAGRVKKCNGGMVHMQLAQGEEILDGAAFPLRPGDSLYYTCSGGRITAVHKFEFPAALEHYNNLVRRHLNQISLPLIFHQRDQSLKRKRSTNIVQFFDQASSEMMATGKCRAKKLTEAYAMFGADHIIEKFLAEWYETRIERALLLIGLSKNDIAAAPLAPHHLLKSISGSVWQAYFLSPERCASIATNRRQPTNKEQILAHGVAYCIHRAMVENLHSCYPRRSLLEIQTSQGRIDEEIIATATKIYGLMEFGGDIYLPEAYSAEREVGKYLGRLVKHDRNAPLNFHLPDIQSGILLSDQQRAAIYGACRARLGIISGAAGCGKTVLIAQIYRLLSGIGQRVMVASFTGKAVARLNQVLPGGRAITLNMAIASPQIRKSFRDIDVLIIDEFSMVSTELLHQFIQVYGRARFRLILVGDINQLEAIGWGALASTVTGLSEIRHFPLTYNYRSQIIEGENTILENATAILAKRTPLLSRGNFLIKRDLPVAVSSVNLLVEALYQKDVPRDKFVVITPYREGLTEINAFTQGLYRRGKTLTRDPRGGMWAVGDKIRARVNDYKRNIMNGQEGVLTTIGPREIAARFGEQDTRYTLNEIGRYVDLAYAITVHLSQGSEWDIVIFYMPQRAASSRGFLNSTLIYTALTRARRYVFFVGDERQLFAAVHTDPAPRLNHLAEMIREEL